jgi:ferritin-like metal-binding protein YciE
MAIQSPKELFFYNLCAMYDAEQKLTQILPILAQESQQEQVKTAFLQHQEETQQHVRNLEQCFQIIGKMPVPMENHAVIGLRQDHDAFLQQQPSPQILTLFDIAAGSKNEHLEIAAYHGLIEEATSLGLKQCVTLFQQNLQQEEAASKKLSALAHQLGQQVA